MQLEFRIRKGNLLDSVREYAQRRLHFALDRYGNRIGRVTVRITDLNGPRGGIEGVSNQRRSRFFGGFGTGGTADSDEGGH